MQNGINNDSNDVGSLYGTTRSGPPSGWINALAAGGGAAAGIGTQSTLSRKSGKDGSREARIQVACERPKTYVFPLHGESTHRVFRLASSNFFLFLVHQAIYRRSFLRSKSLYGSLQLA